jgi:hypothetical protein
MKIIESLLSLLINVYTFVKQFKESDINSIFEKCEIIFQNLFSVVLFGHFCVSKGNNCKKREASLPLILFLVLFRYRSHHHPHKSDCT